MNPRRQGHGLVLTCLLLGAGGGAFALGAPRAAEESPARAQVEQLIRQAGADVSVAFRALDGTQELFLHADKEFPASPAVVQMPIMMELFEEVRAGELRLTDTVVLQNHFQSLLSGETYTLNPQTDPDRELYKSIGKPMTLGDLCEHMTARNSSLAAAQLIEKLGAEKIRRRIEQLHARGFQLLRGMEPENLEDTKPENQASARAMFEALWALAKGQENGDASSTQMIGMLARTALSQPPTAGMPEDPREADSKQLAGIGENAMIVFGPHSYVVVVVVRGIADSESRAELIAQIEHALAAKLGVNS